MNLARLKKSEGVIIDTNLLVLWVIGALDVDRIQTNNLTNTYTADDYFLLLRIVDFYQQRLITTPNILTEASNLLKKTSYNGVHAFSILEQIAKLLKEEIINSLEAMQTFSQSYSKFGLTDAVIHVLARQKYTVFTQDLPLCAYLENLGLSTVNFNHLRADNLLH